MNLNLRMPSGPPPEWSGRRRSKALMVLKGLLLVVCWAVLIAGLFGTHWLSGYVDEVPPVPLLENKVPAVSTVIYSQDGTRIGGLVRGRKGFVHAHAMSPQLITAFLAAEDDAFYTHGGVDPVAVGRAFLANRAAGRVVQGGSTLTQQVAKRFVGDQRSYDRKIIEALLARKLEAEYSKTQILEAYLNQVYVGAGAYGVGAAADIYFDTVPAELSWTQAAMIAGVTHSPSRLNPFKYPERVKRRRNRVLSRLVTMGVLSRPEYETLAESPLGLRTSFEGDEDTMPYVSVWVREYLKRVYGEDVMQDGGLTVHVAPKVATQDRGRAAVQKGLVALDLRQGYRGPIAHISPTEWGEFSTGLAGHYKLEASSDWPNEGPWLALVTEVKRFKVTVDIGGRTVDLPKEGLLWAAPYKLDRRANERVLEDARQILAPGDVVLAAYDTHTYWEKPPQQRRRKRDDPKTRTGWRLAQFPLVEGALLSADTQTGYVESVIGGYDFDRNEFNRALQGCRQPGSVFKPVVYTRALEKGLTMATMLTDTPKKIEKSSGEVWRPRNADRKFAGYILLRDALARSRNIPTVEVFESVGVRGTQAMAKRLGLTTRMASGEAISLGASCVKPLDIIRMYSTFARRGSRVEPRIILSVRDEDGSYLEDHGHPLDPNAPLERIIYRQSRLLRPKQVLSEKIAYLMQHALRAVVYAGTAYGATELGVSVGGKTGTTNAYDAWFVGFTSELVSAVWVGADDNKRPIGSRESGGRVALPVWLDYMRYANTLVPGGPITNDMPEGVEMKRIDRETGLLSLEGEPGVDLPFIEGSAPTEFAPSREEAAAHAVDRESSTF